MLRCSVLLLPLCAQSYTILSDTDFPGYDLSGSKVTPTVDACAQLCEGTSGCVAASWNGPSSYYKDSNCNLKCSSLFPSTDTGETGLVIKSNTSTCTSPSPAPPPSPSPHFPPPPEWEEGVKRADIYYTYQEPVENLRATIGNGYLASVIHSNAIYVAGVFNGGDPPMSDITHRARIPSTLSVSVNIVGSDRGEQIVNNTCFGLDIRKAVYTQRLQLASSHEQKGSHISGNGAVNSDDTIIYLHTYAHRGFSSIGVVWIEGVNISPSTNIYVTLSNQSQGVIKSEDFNITSTKKMNVILSDGSISPVIVFSGHTLIPEINNTATTNITVVTTEIMNNFTYALNESHNSILLLTAIRTSLESTSTEEDALNDYRNAMSVSFTSSSTSSSSFSANSVSSVATDLFASHAKAWEIIWLSGIETDRFDVAQAVNTSLYYIISSMRDDTIFSLSPGGLASNGYNGHTFWDCETWMYPSFVLLQPALASSLLLYRYQRQAGAVSKARSYSPPFNGTMFPWESALQGVEACPAWAATGQLEQHISGDIAVAVRQYFEASGDIKWLKEVGYPLVRGIADFWVSKIVVSSDGSAHINHVIPPDEYAMGDDSVYTNQVAKVSLEFATAASVLLGATPDPRWSQLAQALVILFNQKLNIHPEYQGYSGQKIKQADVVLLGYPLMMPMSVDVRASDLLYYAKVTDNGGPAMTWGMHTIGFIEIGDYASVASNFNRSFANSQPPFGIWTETPTGGTTNFITGAGGFLQTVLFGFGGFRIMPDRLFFKPTIMEGAQSMTVRGLMYRNVMLDISFDADHTRCLLLAAPSSFKVSVLDTLTNSSVLLSEGVPASFGGLRSLAILVA